MSRQTLPARRTCLITGASAGIGQALALAFARHGWDLVLTARREDRLDEIARDLEQRCGISVSSITADLADPNAPAQIFDSLQSSNIQIDALVNNAGYGLKGRFLKPDWTRNRDQIEVMLTAPAHLCYLFLPGMVERGFGRILNVSSLSGLLPSSPGSSMYGGIKSFLIQLSETLAIEYEGTGVHITALCPGFTYSEFHDVMKTRRAVSRMPNAMWMDADTVAEQGYQAVMAGKTIYVNGWVNKCLAVLAQLVPRSLARLIFGALSRKARID